MIAPTAASNAKGPAHHQTGQVPWRLSAASIGAASTGAGSAAASDAAGAPGVSEATGEGGVESRGSGDAAVARGVTEGAGSGEADGRDAGVALTRGGGAGFSVGTGVGAARTGAGAGLGTSVGSALGRTTGFCPSTGPCTRGAPGVAVGSGRLQVLADWAAAEPIPASMSAEIAVATAACEKIVVLPLMTSPSSPHAR
ncbi:hypothetical protein PMI02_03358 [Novosphingobium sp. AP12]|nr:hypothetical protein PMI02_03358 [Novosphingobium sp. AP12]